jgi:PAS domain S-box-containing protein
MAMFDNAALADDKSGLPTPGKPSLDGPVSGIVIIDREGLILEADERVAELSGFRPGEIAGLTVSDLWPLTADKLLALARSPKKAESLKLEEAPRCHLQTSPLPGEAGGLIISVFDPRLFQSAGEASAPADPLTPYYKRIFETSPDGISICDNQGRLVLVNQATADQTGLAVSELLGRTGGSLVEGGYQDRCVCQDVLKTKKPVTKLVRRHKTGRCILATGNPILGSDGEVQLVVINERDLTEALALMPDPEEAGWLEKKLSGESLLAAPAAAAGVVAQSPKMRQILATAAKLARHGVREVTITGESGTGKGMIAKFLHANSKNAAEPFIHLNCAAMPETLLEAELFGYERGVFTGANPGGRAGLFETAGKGVVFLDEIGEMPLTIQAKLLTFLDNHEFRRVGGSKNLSSPCSIIAATTRDLELLVAQKIFREDLYFRLGVFCLRLPPLRERPEDVVEMARRKLSELNHRYSKSAILDPLALETLRSYDFPGNVRELFNCLHQSVILSPSPQLGEFLKGYLESKSSRLPACPARSRQEIFPAPGPAPPEAEDLTGNLDLTERTILQNALATCRSTREMAARLGISQAGVSRKLRKHNLPPPGRRPGFQKEPASA